MAKKHRPKQTKKINDLDNHNGVITHLDPDILGWGVKWPLEGITMNKARGNDEIPVELFQILKDNAVKVLHSICQRIWKTQQCQQDLKRSVFIPIPKKGNAKECSYPEEIVKHLNKTSLRKVSTKQLKEYIQSIQRRQWQPTPVFSPGKSQGQRSLVGCCLWGRTESDTTDAA